MCARHGRKSRHELVGLTVGLLYQAASRQIVAERPNVNAVVAAIDANCAKPARDALLGRWLHRLIVGLEALAYRYGRNRSAILDP